MFLSTRNLCKIRYSCFHWTLKTWKRTARTRSYHRRWNLCDILRLLGVINTLQAPPPGIHRVLSCLLLRMWTRILSCFTPLLTDSSSYFWSLCTPGKFPPRLATSACSWSRSRQLKALFGFRTFRKSWPCRTFLFLFLALWSAALLRITLLYPTPSGKFDSFPMQRWILNYLQVPNAQRSPIRL